MEKECEVRCKDEKANLWFNEWLKSFWTNHGVRLIFGGIAIIMAVCFIWLGKGDIIASGKTILIGCAMLAYNKARGSENGKDQK